MGDPRRESRPAHAWYGCQVVPALARSLTSMTFAELAGYLDRMESTSSRNELVRTLAEIYQKSSADEIQPITYLIQGRLVPFFEPVEIGLGDRLVISAIAQAFDRPVDEVDRLLGKVGDLGLVA